MHTSVWRVRALSSLALSLGLAFSSLAVADAVVCTLDDCAVPGWYHQVDGVHLGDYQDGRAVLGGAWSWMVHDLATARYELRHGQRAAGLTLLADLDRAMRAQGEAMAHVLGTDTVRALHDAVRDAVADAGAFPLAALDLPDVPAAERARTAEADDAAPAQDTAASDHQAVPTELARGHLGS